MKGDSTTPSQLQRLDAAPGSKNGWGGMTPAFDMTDEETVVIGIVHGLTDADFPPAELHASDFGQFAARIDAVVFRIVLLVAGAAGRRDHGVPRFQCVVDWVMA